VRRLLLGSINGGGFFTGDLASFLLFPECALTEAEMTSLSAALALKYGIRFVSRGNTTIPQGTVTVGGGDVEIYSGAALLLPAATNSPVTLISGQTISGGGTVRGTLALDANATVDIGLAETLTMDALWLRDGSAVCWHHAGNTGNLLSVATLKTAGFATLRIAGGDDLPVRASVIAYTSGTGLDATVWTVTGGKRNTRVEINATAKTIDVVTPKGTLVLIN